MQNSKLIQVLKTFSKEEWKNFEKLVSSPYFNKGRNYKPLLRELRKFYPDFNSAKLSSEYLYLKLYPGKNHNRNVIKTLFTGLYRITEEFLIQLDFGNREFKRNISLLYQLSSRNINGIHDKIIDEIEQKLKTQKASQDMFESLHLLQAHKVVHSYNKSGFEKTIGENIPLRGDYNVFSFIITMLNTVRDLKVLKDDYNLTIERNFSEQIFDELNIEKFLSYTRKLYPHFSPVIETVIKCFIASATINNIYFEAKESLFKNMDRFDNKFLREITLAMVDAATLRLQSGHREFIGELCLLHSHSLENGFHIYEDSKYIHHFIADTFIFLAFWNNEPELISKFLTERRYELPPESRAYLSSIGNAYICFSRKDYRKALTILSTIDTKLFPFKRKVYVLQLQTYYELNEYELGLSGLDSYKHFISNNKKYVEKAKNQASLFASLYERILKHKLGSAKTNIKEIRETIAKQIPLQGLDWILEKIDELEKIK